MSQRIAPREGQAQELRARLQGQSDAQRGEELVSPLGRRATARVWQEALEHDPAAELGRVRYERRPQTPGARNGSEAGTLKPAAGGRRVKLPQSRGQEEPYRSQLWSTRARTREGRNRLRVAMYGGGRSQGDSEYRLEPALGQVVLSTSTVSELRDSGAPEYQALRTRELSGSAGASRLSEAVYDPWRRWGSQTGVLGGWALWVEGRKGLGSLAPAHRQSSESWLEGWRALRKRGRPTPGTMTTAGAVGLTTARAALWPQSVGLGCWVPKRQHFQPKVPPQAWPEFTALVGALPETRPGWRKRRGGPKRG